MTDEPGRNLAPAAGPGPATIGLAVGEGTGPELAEVFERAVGCLSQAHDARVAIETCPRRFRTYGAFALDGVSASEAASATLRCDISETDVPSPAKPSSCQLDYGQAFEMTATSKPRRICHGDTALGGETVLGYGQSIPAGPFRCTSRVRGLTCRNRAGHGWFLSRSSIQLF